MKNLILALVLSACPVVSAQAVTATLNLDATANTAGQTEGAAAIAAGDLLSITVGDGSIFIEAVAGVLWSAYKFNSEIITCFGATGTCQNGFTVNYNIFDATGALVDGFGIRNSYGSQAEALQAARLFGPKEVVLTAGTYYFAIGDGINSRGDNGGGVSLSVTYVAPSQIPLPATGLLLVGAVGALSLARRKR